MQYYTNGSAPEASPKKGRPVVIANVEKDACTQQQLLSAAGPRRTRVLTKEFIENAHPSVREVSFVDEADPYLTHAKGQRASFTASTGTTSAFGREEGGISKQIPLPGSGQSAGQGTVPDGDRVRWGPGAARPVGGRRDEPTPKVSYAMPIPTPGLQKEFTGEMDKHLLSFIIECPSFTRHSLTRQYRLEKDKTAVNFAKSILRCRLQQEFTTPSCGRIGKVRPQSLSSPSVRHI
ncbi:hypothetical protein Bbelb_321480 [Branchiostoma belcheri]|nr:hypothetical protein Bbelb_321480 [Branchiostoma belcheri]